MTQAQDYRPRVVSSRGELEVCTALVRRFLTIADDEPVELCAFVRGKPWVTHAHSEAEHIRMLHEAEQLRDFGGAYMLVNGPIDPALCYRYEPGKWQAAWNGRATDRDVRDGRAAYFDCDPIRPKGISSTDDQKREAFEVAHELRGLLEETVGRSSVGFGSSGNGSFILVALEPFEPTAETTAKIARLLKLLAKRFDTERVKLDISVSNPARLMPAPGTWKRKGIDTPERPHRRTSFSCGGNVTRVPLEVLCG